MKWFRFGETMAYVGFEPYMGTVLVQVWGAELAVGTSDLSGRRAAILETHRREELASVLEAVAQEIRQCG